MEKNHWFIIFLLVLLITPLTSAVLSDADSRASSTVIWVIFGVGLVLVVFGYLVFHSEIAWFIGAFLMGVGLILILYSFYTAINLSQQVTTYSALSGQTDKIASRVARIFKYLTWFIFAGFVYWIYHLWGTKKVKEAEDGWDGNK